jgi:hypothetical protein
VNVKAILVTSVPESLMSQSFGHRFCLRRIHYLHLLQEPCRNLESQPFDILKIYAIFRSIWGWTPFFGPRNAQIKLGFRAVHD